MRATMQKLVEICGRAGLTITSVEKDLDESGAAADVDDVWPGRDPEDGAIALLSTSLHAALDARRTTPTKAVLGDSPTWKVMPPEQPQRDPSTGPAHWEAPPRDGHR